MNLKDINPVWIFLAVAVIMLLFMKNKEGETFLDTLKDSLEVFTQNPMLLVIIGIVVFLFISKKDEQKQIGQ